MRTITLLLLTVSLLTSCGKPNEPASAPPTAREKLLARADSLALDTNYTVPPGNPLSHYTAGYAKIMCSAVFITGLDPDFAAANVGYFTSPPEERAKVDKPIIDRVNKKVSVRLPNGVTRTAVYTGSQGCVALPEGSDQLSFKPTRIIPGPGNSAAKEWPMGEKLSAAYPAEVNRTPVSYTHLRAHET